MTLEGTGWLYEEGARFILHAHPSWLPGRTEPCLILPHHTEDREETAQGLKCMSLEQVGYLQGLGENSGLGLILSDPQNIYCSYPISLL
jgi:hypothetical protein